MKEKKERYRGFVTAADQIAIYIETRLENLVFNVASVVSQGITVSHLDKVARNATCSMHSHHALQRKINGE